MGRGEGRRVWIVDILVGRGREVGWWGGGAG